MGGVENGWPEKDMKRGRTAPIRLGRASVQWTFVAVVGLASSLSKTLSTYR